MSDWKAEYERAFFRANGKKARVGAGDSRGWYRIHHVEEGESSGNYRRAQIESFTKTLLAREPAA